MECQLHRRLKDRHGPDRGGRVEVAVAGYRIDAVEPSGRLVEVQTGALAPLRPKLARLLPDHPVLVVKPVPVRRRIAWRDRAGRDAAPARRSPWRGSLLDVFDDLVGLAGVFPHPNLAVDVVAVDVVEVRLARRRRPGFAVVDRELAEVIETVPLRAAADLWQLLPAEKLGPGPWTTRDLAGAIGRPMPLAQRVAYCLLHAGAVEVVGKVGSFRRYAPVSGSAAPTAPPRSGPPGRAR